MSTVDVDTPHGPARVHLHHFHTRPQLVAAALSELAQRREDFFREQVAQLPRGDDRIECALARDQLAAAIRANGAERAPSA